MNDKLNKFITDKVIMYRFLLVIIVIFYFLFGVIYQTGQIKADLLPIKQRVFMSLLACGLIFLSFISNQVKEKIEELVYVFFYVATIHLIYFAYLNHYSINYSISILAVIIVVNFIIRTQFSLKYYNLVITSLVFLSVYFVSEPQIDKLFYSLITGFVVLASYIIHSQKLYLLTQIKKSQQQYCKLSARQKLLLDNIELQVWYLTDPKTYGAVNRAHAQFLGFTKEELENKAIGNFFSEQEAASYIETNQTVFRDKKQLQEKKWITNQEGEERLLAITKAPKLNQQGKVEYIICTAEDITETRQAKNEIKYLSFHDSLTGLYNRSYFEQELDRLDTKRQLPLSIIVGDINGLKLTNDAFGHQMGDKLLKKAAQALKDSCREEDIIARWGGDEFVVLLPQTDKADVKKVCKRIKSNCEAVEMELVEISISLGYATKRKTVQDSEDIFKKAEDWMYRKKLKESKSYHSNLLKSLEETLRKKTNETVEHGKRIKKLALIIGEELGLSEQKLDNLGLLGQLHDLGKVGISEDILKKQAPLTEEEVEEMERHAEIGCQIAESSLELNNIAREISSHHEWWDGSGYPQGLKGEEVPITARIISIVDAYDVMVNGRPYQKAVSRDKAVQQLKARAGTQFDPELVKVFIKLWEEGKIKNEEPSRR